MGKVEKKADEQQENTTPAVSDESNQEPDEGVNSSPDEGAESEGDNGSSPDEGAADEEKKENEEAKVLVALVYILYNSKQYAPGDELPANDAGMVEAWLEAKTAAWINESAVRAKARPVTALPGATGDAIHSESEDGENLVGRVPRTSNRRK